MSRFDQFIQKQWEEMLRFVYDEVVTQRPHLKETDFKVLEIDKSYRQVKVRLGGFNRSFGYRTDPVSGILTYIDQHYKPKTQLDLLDEYEREARHAGDFPCARGLEARGYATYFRELSLIELRFVGERPSLYRFKSRTKVANPYVCSSTLEPVEIVGVDE